MRDALSHLVCHVLKQEAACLSNTVSVNKCHQNILNGHHTIAICQQFLGLKVTTDVTIGFRHMVM